MVTVISTAPHPSVVKEVVCKNCGATLSYVPADVKKQTHFDYGGGSDIVSHIVCPPCGNKVVVR